MYNATEEAHGAAPFANCIIELDLSLTLITEKLGGFVCFAASTDAQEGTHEVMDIRATCNLQNEIENETGNTHSS